ncbi:hypothetical protein BDZ89DRAFT_1118163 [Hymenopellis radicata]|nr:hypothetical protein BDZ89DRAFT_1118163 [Hymenopellis radicata]
MPRRLAKVAVAIWSDAIEHKLRARKGVYLPPGSLNSGAGDGGEEKMPADAGLTARNTRATSVQPYRLLTFDNHHHRHQKMPLFHKKTPKTPRPPATLADLEAMCEAIKDKSPADISDNLRTEMGDCQDAWDTALRDIARVNDFLKERQTSGPGSLPAELVRAFTSLRMAMIKIMELYLDFQDAGRVKRAFNRKAWCAKADQCSRDLNSVMQIFNSDIGISTFLLIQSLTVSQPQTFISAQHVLAYDAPSQYFVGRQDILLQLKSIFEISASKGCIVSLCGKGGSGKTQIALKFISENQAMLLLLIIQKPLEVDEWVKPVYEYLRSLQEKWLIILDNADDSNVKLPLYIPQYIYGYILITSRLSDQWASPNCRINCGDLSKKDAIDLLLKRTDTVLTEENYQYTSKIVTELGYYALAIATAGAYIQIFKDKTLIKEQFTQHFY